MHSDLPRRMEDGRQGPLRRLRSAAALGLAMAASLGAQTGLVFLQAPSGEVFSDSLVRVTIASLPSAALPADSCDLYRGPRPAGNALAGHGFRIAAAKTPSADASSIRFSFRPSDRDSATGSAQLGLGIHYLVASCREGQSVSAEIPLWVSTRQAASFLSPKSLETSSSPGISWSPVPGVPAYHLLLSDQAFAIDQEKGTVSGASIIWQAITTGTSIAYGTPDPSGNFSKVPAPPLSPDVPYNLVVLNNYDGRSALASSSKAQGLRLFTIQGSSSLKPPAGLAPARGEILAAARDSVLTFRWTKARAASGSEANTYKLFVYSLESQDAGEVLFPIWHVEVTDTFAVMDAKRTLLTKRYIWKVFALNDAGTSVVGDTSSFQYRNDVQTLSIRARTIGPAGDTVPLGDVRIDVRPADGGGDPLPLFTLNTGGAEKILGVGGYSLAFSKDGYLSATRSVSLDLSGPLTVAQLLPAASCRLTGRAVDAGGQGLVNVKVTASGGGAQVSTVTDAQGSFLLGVAAGTHSVSLSKPDFISPPDTSVILAQGKSADLGRLTLAKAQGSLTGSVANEKGVPLAGARITVKSASGAVERSLLTDGKGAFAAFLAPGTYLVSAERAGFSSETRTVRLIESAQVGFALSSGASLLKGRISLSARPDAAALQTGPLAGATVELRGASGSAVRSAEADLRGEFSLSADTGSYVLKASFPGRAHPESVAVRINLPRSTLTKDLTLRGFATVSGTIAFSPDTLVGSAEVSVGLLAQPSQALIASVTPQPAPGPRGVGAMSFALEGIPDGTYRLACGVDGFGLEAEPAVSVSGGVWKTGLDLTLVRAGKSVTFAMTAEGEPAAGTIRLLAPRAAEIPAGVKLDRAAAGTYVLNAVPDSAAVIPLFRHPFFLPASGPDDTTLAIDLPFSHRPQPLSFRDQEVEMSLQAGAAIDSALLVYGYGAPTDTFRIPLPEPATKGPLDFRFRPGAQGGLLTYYFVIRSGAFRYSNEEAPRRFRAAVNPSPAMAFLKLAAADSLRLPARARGEIHLHAYDAAGRSLDTAVDARGTVTWKADADLEVNLDRSSRRTLAYRTAAPTKRLAKRSAAAPWPSLSVTVELDGVSETLSVPVRVVDAVINKLVLSSTLGEVPEISSPEPFGLSVSGFDTTTTPPTPLVPHAVLTLDPPGAGSLGEMRAEPHADFIGPLRILAKQINADGSEAVTELGAYRDSLSRGLNIGQTLAAGDSGRLLFHDAEFEMRIPDSALAGGGVSVLRLYKRKVSKSFANDPGHAVVGDLYEISNPSGAGFSRPPVAFLGIPAASRSRAIALKRFDAFRLEWTDPADSVSSDSNSFGAPARSVAVREMDGGFYGLLGASRGLTAGEVRIIPNPFSPLVIAARDGNTAPGARIRFHPESDRSSEVTVSIRIYNLDGELVRLLVDHKTVPKEPADFYWDGKADGGRWARNGRYTVKISVNATGDTRMRHIVKPIVVFR